MQNKAARKRAAKVNQLINPELKPDQGSKRLGKHIAPNRRDFHKILNFLEHNIRENESLAIPRELSAAHVVVVKRLYEFALRDCKTTEIQTCPKCGEAIDVQVYNDKHEKNTMTALEVLFDRMAPKLATLTHEVNVHQTVINIGSGMATVILKFVTPENRMACMAAVQAVIAEAQQQGMAQHAAVSGQIPYTPGT